MTAYSVVRNEIQSGDTVACKRRAWFSILIRIFTAESTNHTAVLLRDPEGGVWVTEMREGEGYQCVPASQWFAEQLSKKVSVTYCKAPQGTNPLKARAKILKTRAEDPRYGYFTLLLVHWSQILGIKFQGKYPVCSTYAQDVHEAADYEGYKKLCDPGDIEEHAPIKVKITKV